MPGALMQFHATMNTPISKPGLSRRRFLAVAGAAVAAPTFIPARALGRDGNTAPSNRIVMGVVGWGMQGPQNADALMGYDNGQACQVVASCNIDKNHLAASLQHINEHNGNKDAKGYHDYREMMARTDIDAVMIAVPDNWHELIAVEALKNKKDVYGEKPLARTIVEQQRIVHAVQTHKRIWQMGSWQRSQWFFSQGGRNRAQRVDRENHGSPCRAAGGACGFRAHGAGVAGETGQAEA